MAPLIVTDSGVLPTETTSFDVVTAGATITAGMPVYLKGSDGNTAWPADNGKLGVANVIGVAMCNAGDGQPVVIAISGDINIGAVMVAGESYSLGSNSGSIIPTSDLENGEYETRIGIATATNKLKLSLFAGNTAMVSP